MPSLLTGRKEHVRNKQMFKSEGAVACAPMGINGFLHGDGTPTLSPWGHISDEPVEPVAKAAASEVLDDSTKYASVNNIEPWAFWEQVAQQYHSPPECSSNCAAAAVGGDAPTFALLRDADGDVVPALACCAFGAPALGGGNPAILPDTDVTIHADKHRDKIAPRRFPFNALVARPVRKDELAATPKAKEAMDAEWDRLLKANVWDTENVREWDDVAAEALRDEKEVKFGSPLWNLCGKWVRAPEGRQGPKV